MEDEPIEDQISFDELLRIDEEQMYYDQVVKPQDNKENNKRKK